MNQLGEPVHHPTRECLEAWAWQAACAATEWCAADVNQGRASAYLFAAGYAPNLEQLDGFIAAAAFAVALGHLGPPRVRYPWGVSNFVGGAVPPDAFVPWVEREAA